MNKLYLAAFFNLFFSQISLAQTDTNSLQALQNQLNQLQKELEMLKTQPAKADSCQPKRKNFHIEGAGAMNYYHFDWQTDTVKRDGIDNERFVLEFEYSWTDKIGLNAELEFEHGGTGSAVEFDRFEEFGEFEFDISKGGEILIEQMNLDFRLHQRSHLQLGRVKVPFGRMFLRSEPTQYLTAISSEMENFILPENWTENGFLLSANLGKKEQFRFHLAFVNGLDCSAFNSANWIKRGNQSRFELANAENFAGCFRFDYRPNPNLIAGAAFYAGNTANNRPKPDLRISAPLLLSEAHFLYENDYINASAMLLYGHLSNSEEVSNRNRNLSNNLNVKRTPVGAAALGYFAELGVKILNPKGGLIHHPVYSLIAYARYDYYDTMFKTQGDIFNNPRWERQTYTAGLNFQLIKNVHLKAQYSLRQVGAPAPTSINGGVNEQTIIAGFGFSF